MDIWSLLSIPLSYFGIFIKIVISWWWLYLPFLLLALTWGLRIQNQRVKYFQNMDWVILEIRPPKDIKKTPKAMEQIFAGLHGFQSTPNWWEKNIKGKVQDWFSFEIVGQSGYIRFFVRTRTIYRNFVEAQIYAQYPQAEINEVDDYVLAVPKDVPSKDYDLWGTELVFTNEDAYPIRTYAYFEKDLILEEQRIDPLASISEIMAKLQEGENIWIQTLVRPLDHKWRKISEQQRDKLIGRKKINKPTILENFAGGLLGITHDVLSSLLTSAESEGFKKEDKKDQNPMMSMTQFERESVTALEIKMSKVAYDVIIRFIYHAPTSIFSKPNAGGVIGCYKLFSDQNLNGFKPNAKLTTKIDYGIQLKGPREYARKKKLLAAYQKREFVNYSIALSYLKPLFHESLPILRNFFNKSRPIIMNVEELASIYHFPGLMAEAPTLPRVEAKKSGPPDSLPTG